jgi:hypothetical protein
MVVAAWSGCRAAGRFRDGGKKIRMFVWWLDLAEGGRFPATPRT